MFLCVTEQVEPDVSKDCVASTLKVRQFKATCTMTHQCIPDTLNHQHRCCGNIMCPMHSAVTDSFTKQVINNTFYELLIGRT